MSDGWGNGETPTEEWGGNSYRFPTNRPGEEDWEEYAEEDLPGASLFYSDWGIPTSSNTYSTRDDSLRNRLVGVVEDSAYGGDNVTH
jgi:hypothetical protein